MFRLKSYLTGFICLFAYLFISSLTQPVRATETCTGAPTWNDCVYNSDCGSPHTCSCRSSWKYCTITAPTATPVPYTCTQTSGQFCFGYSCSSWNYCSGSGTCYAAQNCCKTCPPTATPIPPTPTPTPPHIPNDNYCNYTTGRC
ncbi:MAG: hypothetical protein AAB437_05415, partial [Patescibacteria group bacterium]